MNTGPGTIFLSYCHSDRAHLDRLLVHLKPLSLPHDVWSDQRIEPGADWLQEIRIALQRAKVGVLLVSADFLASEFVRREEMPALLESAHNGDCQIFWIPISPCLFEDSPLARFQAAIPPSKPITKFSRKADRDEAWTEVARQIKKAAAMATRPATLALDTTRMFQPRTDEICKVFTQQISERGFVSVRGEWQMSRLWSGKTYSPPLAVGVGFEAELMVSPIDGTVHWNVETEEDQFPLGELICDFEVIQRLRVVRGPDLFLGDYYRALALTMPNPFRGTITEVSRLEGDYAQWQGVAFVGQQD